MENSNNTDSINEAISVWLLFKSETTSGNIKNYCSQLPKLLEKYKIDPEVFKNCLIWYITEGLVRIEKGNLFMRSYTMLIKYGIDIKNSKSHIAVK